MEPLHEKNHFGSVSDNEDQCTNLRPELNMKKRKRKAKYGQDFLKELMDSGEEEEKEEKKKKNDNTAKHKINRIENGVSQTIKKKRIEYNPDIKVELQISISEEDWQTLSPKEVQHKDRIATTFTGDWSHYFIQKLWELFQLPCPFTFKNHKFLKKPKSPLVTFFGKCQECGNPIDGFIPKESPVRFPMLATIRTHDTKGLHHVTNTNLSGNRREEAQNVLLNKKPKKYRDELAADILNESGTKPPYYISEAVASTVRKEALDKESGVDDYPGDTLTAVSAMKKDFPLYIRGITAFPLIIYYWTENQTKLWNDANASKWHFPISIDATGSVVRTPTLIGDFKSSPLFLYNITFRLKSHVYSICQMLSSKHDNYTIRDWICAWLASGATYPRECVCDCSYALLIAISKALNKCDYDTFLDRLHLFITGQIDELPYCWIRRDRAHLIKAICVWLCFQGNNWTKKDFYVRVIAYTLEVEDLSELSKIILAVFVVCQSNFIDEGSNCKKYYDELCDKIESVDYYKKKYNIDSPTDHFDCKGNSCCMVDLANGEADYTKDESAEAKQEEAVGAGARNYVHDIEVASKTLLTNGTFKTVNPYYLPSIMSNLITLFRQYGSWTNVPRKHYLKLSNVSKTATSTGSEVYYRILKNEYEILNCAIKTMLLKHKRLIDGSTKNGRLDLKLLFEEICENSTSEPATSEVNELEAAAPKISNLREFHREAQVSRPQIIQNRISKSIVVTSHEKSISSELEYYLVIVSHYYYVNLPYLNSKESTCTLSLSALNSLKGINYLHGEIIDSMMAIFKKNAEWQDVFIFPSYHTNFILGERCTDLHGDQWTMYHIKHHFYGIVFLPYCLKEHWRLLMLNIRQKKIYHYDPMPWENDYDQEEAQKTKKRQKKEKERAITAFLDYLKKSKEQNNLCKIDWTWDKEIDPMGDLPRQKDGHNCGTLVLYYMLVLSSLEKIDNFNPDRYRCEIKNRLLNESDAVNLTCLYCLNSPQGDTVHCKICARWAHRKCLERSYYVEGILRNKKTLCDGVCEVCKYLEV